MVSTTVASDWRRKQIIVKAVRHLGMDRGIRVNTAAQKEMAHVTDGGLMTSNYVVVC